MTDLKPFADDGVVVQIADLSIENGADVVSVHGSLDVAKDARGLADARALRDAAQALVNALEAMGDLPAKAPEAPVRNGRVKSPFD